MVRRVRPLARSGWLLFVFLLIPHGLLAVPCKEFSKQITRLRHCVGEQNTKNLFNQKTPRVLLKIEKKRGRYRVRATPPPSDASVETLRKKLQEEVSENPKTLFSSFSLLLGSGLGFLMIFGFGLFQSGFGRAKNAVHVFATLFLGAAVALLAFWLIGFGLMFGKGESPLLASSGILMLSGKDFSPLGMVPFKALGFYWVYQGDYPALALWSVSLYVKFLFYASMVVVGIGIYSGILAERVRFFSSLVFGLVWAGIIFPIASHWAWGTDPHPGMALKNIFLDNAGAGVLHVFAGLSGLAGLLLVGPRIGKFRRDGGANLLPGHSMTNVFLGAGLLMPGLLGFIFGRTLSVPAVMGAVLAAASGAVSSTLLALPVSKKPDFGMMVLGCLGALVAVSGSAGIITFPQAILLGFLSGGVVLLGVLLMDKLKLDDPAGLVPVHLFCGILGLLAVPFAHLSQRVSNQMDLTLFFGLMRGQVIGLLVTGLFVFSTSLVTWLIIRATIGLRVNAEEEAMGLDYSQHGNVAYPDFQGQFHHLS